MNLPEPQKKKTPKSKNPVLDGFNRNKKALLEYYEKLKKSEKKWDSQTLAGIRIPLHKKDTMMMDVYRGGELILRLNNDRVTYYEPQDTFCLEYSRIVLKLKGVK